jgi:hypothetical protein
MTLPMIGVVQKQTCTRLTKGEDDADDVAMIAPSGAQDSARLLPWPGRTFTNPSEWRMCAHVDGSLQ